MCNRKRGFFTRIYIPHFVRLIIWLDDYEEGPYLEEIKSSHNFYYLGGYHSKWGYNWIQVFSGQFNILSLDCLDSINLWTFDEINLSVPKNDF